MLEQFKSTNHHARQISLISDPLMPFLNDGVLLEQDSLSNHGYSHALSVMRSTSLTDQTAAITSGAAKTVRGLAQDE